MAGYLDRRSPRQSAPAIDNEGVWLENGKLFMSTVHGLD